MREFRTIRISTVNVGIKMEQYKRLKRLSKKTKRSMNSYVQEAVNKLLEARE